MMLVSVMVLACGGDDGKTHLYTTPLSTANNEVNWKQFVLFHVSKLITVC